MRFKYKIVFSLMAASVSFSCAKKPTETAASTAPTRYLYVASGTCYSGGNTMPTPSNLIYKVSLDTGVADSILADYSVVTETTGNTPVSIIDYDSDYLMALIDNTTNVGGRKLEKVPKRLGGTKQFYFYNAQAFTNTLRSMTKNPVDGSLLVSRYTSPSSSAAIEKIDAIPSRRVIGASTPWVNAPGGSCATSTNFITSVQTTSNGKIIYTNAFAGQNRIGMISANGYITAADCLLTSSVTSPVVASAYPTASVYMSDTKQLLVLYAGNATTTDFNSIYAYDVDESTGAITGGTRAFSDTNVIYGGSAITYDSVNKYVYVATSNASATTITNYNIEKFSYDPGTKTLTRASNIPFSTSWLGSKCISSMFVGE